MNSVKALFFDVGGTVFDWKNTAREQKRPKSSGTVFCHASFWDITNPLYKLI